MSGRRSDARFVITNGHGVLRVGRDVTITSANREMVAISKEPATRGDTMTVDMVLDGYVHRVAVRVEESRPIVTDGMIRYEIRLSPLDPGGKAVDFDTGK
jgi:hypothetical protein